MNSTKTANLNHYTPRVSATYLVVYPEFNPLRLLFPVYNW